VPISGQSQIQTLSGFLIAGSDPGDYGKLDMYVTPRDQPVQGPSIVAAKIDATKAVSQQVSLLNQNGSSVQLGNVLMIPIANSLLYIQPLYVQSSRNTFPELQQVIAVYGNQPAAIGGSLSQALTTLFTAPVSTTPGGSSSTGALSPQVRALLNAAQAAYAQGQVDLKAGNLGAYQSDIQTLESNLQEVQQLTGATTTPTTSGSTTTTTTTSTTTTTTTP
jgi:hypothetical protein